MASMRDIKNRISSINNTKQITESMRLVSTSKVQKARSRMEGNNPYLVHSVKIIENAVNSALFERHEYITGNSSEKSLIIMITSDRGLCGGYNSNVGKEALTLSESLGGAQIIAIGSKGRDYFSRRKEPIAHSFKGLSENPFFEDAQNIGEYALRLYDEKEVGKIFLVNTEYRSMLNLSPKIVRLLPISIGGEPQNVEKAGKFMRYEPGGSVYLDYAVKTYICSMIFGAMLESSVSEQCSRITGMDAAVKNSNELIDKLNLEYNQMRQSAITQEVAEIVGGANAVSQPAR